MAWLSGRVRLAIAGDGLDGPCLFFFAFSFLLSWSEDGTIVLLSGLLWYYKVWRLGREQTTYKVAGWLAWVFM